MTAGLAVQGLAVSFGGLQAVRDVTLRVPPASVTGLIGPNGAGKTTTIDALCGFVAARGTIELDGRRLDGLDPHERARAGLARTFQSIELFDDLTVAENLLVAASPGRWWSTLVDLVAPRRDARRADVGGILDLVGIADIADALPTSLSHGRRRLVSVARALATRPQLLLLDEPAAGLDPDETAALGALLRRLPERGIGVLLVDHDMSLVLDVCRDLVVLDVGAVIADGPTAEVSRDPAVTAAYLGGRLVNPTGERLLDVRGLHAGYGDVEVVHGIDLHVDAGEVVALLGPNGAGKTTTLRTVSALIPPLGGEVDVLGETLRQRARRTDRAASPARIARAGVAHVPEDRGLFFGLTGREHLRLATRRGDAESADRVLDTMPHLRDVVDRRAGRMSGGEQQMLAIARALVARPRLLMVDELSLGLAPIVVQQLLPLLRSVAVDLGIGVLLVEQYVTAALAVADRAHVLFNGRVTLAGDAPSLGEDHARIARSYLGQSD